EAGRPGLVLDTHFYQIFSEEDKRLDFDGRLTKAAEWRTMIGELKTYTQVMVGEWSLALPEKAASLQRYSQAQLEAFNTAGSWFYWTYKTEAMPEWSFRDCVSNGWLTLT